MNQSVTAFNPFDYFQTKQEINEFLLDCLNDDDPNTFVTALGQLAKKKGMTTISQATGLSRESLYKTFNGKTQPKWATIFKVSQALGVQLQIVA